MGFTVEATLGFGATLVTLTLGSLLAPTSTVLFRVVPLNLLLSLAVVLRSRDAVDVRALVTRMLPAILLGLPLGIAALDLLPASLLQRGLGAGVVVLGTLELAGTRGPQAPGRTLKPGLAFLLLFVGGVAHGALASGGPPVVYVTARTLKDKAAIRSTLSALWLVLNVVLVAAYVGRRQVDLATLRESVPLVPGLLAGLWLGEALHRRVSERGFRGAVFAGLLSVGVVLVVRA